MKTYFKYILAPAALAVSLTGCFDLATPGSDTDESIQATVDQSNLRLIANEATATGGTFGCTFTDRKMVKEITNAKGVIIMLTKSADREDASCAIHVPETNQRFTACDLPADMQREGVAVTFSGQVMEIFPNERWMATPFQLTSIQTQMPIRR